MMKIERFLFFVSCIAILAVIAACGDKKTRAEIECIDSIAVKNPYMAISMVDSMMCADSAEMSTRELMKLRLVRGRARNSAGLPLGCKQEIKEMAEYFDKHGTDNERMSAYYVLGSVYGQSQNESSMDALKFYDIAIGLADTMSSWCDYRTLSLVYAAKADILENNFLIDNALEAWMNAYKYSLKTNDRFLIISLFSCMGDTYYLKGDTEKAIRTFKKAYSLFVENGYKDNADLLLGMVAFCYLESDSVVLAKRFAERYLNCPLLFDKNGMLKKGYGIYPYIKGRVYLEENEVDSAKIEFEKLLTEDSNNFKQASFKGLYMLYKKKCIMDSTVKFAELWNAYSDSSYREKAVSQINKMQYAYGYSQRENEMLVMKSKLQSDTFKVILLCCIMLIIIMLFYIVVRNKNIKIKMAGERISVLKLLLEDKENALRIFQDKVSNSSGDIKKYEDKIKFLREEIESLRDEIIVLQNTNSNSDNIKNDILSQIKLKVKKGQVLSTEEKVCFIAYSRKHNPNLVNLMNDKDKLTEKEVLVCCFILYDFVPSEIVCMLDLSSQILSNMRSRLNMKIFKMEGGAKDFDKNLRKYIKYGNTM